MPERIYARHEMMQNKEEERAILEKAVRFGLTALENGEDTP